MYKTTLLTEDKWKAELIPKLIDKMFASYMKDKWQRNWNNHIENFFYIYMDSKNFDETLYVHIEAKVTKLQKEQMGKCR